LRLLIKKEAERILRKIEFHYTPEHAGWLNTAEIEINVMDVECTGRRMENKEFLAKELEAWVKRRNQLKKLNGNLQSKMRMKNYPGII